MRITRDLLLNLARENAAKLAARDRSVLCIYLVGSLLREDPFLGGVTDIDMVCVHDHTPTAGREIVRINADVHLDVAHLAQSVFEHPRRLRANPWVGGSLDEGPLVLHDLLHWFDYTRSSATAQFWQAEHVITRAGSFAAHSRQTWQQLVDEALPQGIKRTQAFLDALSDAANALAVLTGMPLTTRRLLLDLPVRVSALEMTEFTGAFVALFTSDAVNDEQWLAWQPQWLGALDALKPVKDAPLALGITRRNYFCKAASTLASDHPAAALWIMLRTWTQAAGVLPKSEAPYKEWQALARVLELDGRSLHKHIEGLDALLDSVENRIELWQEENA